MININRKNEKFILSEIRDETTVCTLLAPVFVLDGGEVRANIISCENGTAESEVCGFSVTDRVCGVNNGLFRLTRRVRNLKETAVTFKSVIELQTGFIPDHYVFPGLNYDTRGCDTDMGEIICTSKTGLASNFSNTPQGLSADGKPWVFAYDRQGIPSATVSENGEYTAALFASDADKISLESSSSVLENTDGTYTHRLIHPVSEMPYTYAHKNKMEAAYETFLTLAPGEELTFTAYIFAGRPKFRNYGTVSLMEACADVFPLRLRPELTREQVWELGIQYFRFLQKEDHGVPMFSGHISDKLFHRAHSGELAGEDLRRALAEPDSLKLCFFSTSYEIGWAGQGAMIARLMAIDGYRNGKPEQIDIAERCLDGYAASQRENGLLFPLYGQHYLPDEKRRVPDACNMGWAMCEMMRSWRMFASHGKIKQNYYDFAVKLADFTLRNFDPSYGFPKSWTIDGKILSSSGSIGGFLIMGLCEVHRETGRKEYLDTAMKAMDIYYARDLDRFVCTAGAIDCACVDKETAYPFIESALYLYDVTGDGLWLERAEKAAGYFFSWMYFYDALYGPDCDFSRYGYHTTGGTIISAEHGAVDAWGALPVTALFRLWHLTGNDNYLLWARMTWQNALLCIATDDTPEIHGNKRPAGSQNEGFFPCRWTKYRPTCEERGHFNDNLQSWMGAWRLYTLATADSEDLKLLWE